MTVERRVQICAGFANGAVKLKIAVIIITLLLISWVIEVQLVQLQGSSLWEKLKL